MKKNLGLMVVALSPILLVACATVPAKQADVVSAPAPTAAVAKAKTVTETVQVSFSKPFRASKRNEDLPTSPEGMVTAALQAYSRYDYLVAGELFLQSSLVPSVNDTWESASLQSAALCFWLGGKESAAFEIVDRLKGSLDPARASASMMFLMALHAKRDGDEAVLTSALPDSVHKLFNR